MEALEDIRQISGGDAEPVVAHRQPGLAVDGGALEFDPRCRLAVHRIERVRFDDAIDLHAALLAYRIDDLPAFHDSA